MASRTRTPGLLALALLATIVLAGCATAEGDRGADPRTLNPDGVPFSFHYPAELAPSEPAGGVLAAVSAGPRDYIAVRQFAPTALDRADLGRELMLRLLDSDSSARPRQERHNGQQMLRADVPESDARRGGQRRYYVFAAGTGSWAIECRSTMLRAVAMLRACQEALATLDVDQPATAATWPQAPPKPSRRVLPPPVRHVPARRPPVASAQEERGRGWVTTVLGDWSADGPPS